MRHFQQTSAESKGGPNINTLSGIFQLIKSDRIVTINYIIFSYDYISLVIS